jgi:RES domain-containing protein
MRVWRICKSLYSVAAFSGEGARLFAGRWNPAGVRMVYCATSLSLATLEFFVHLDPGVAPDDLVSVMAEIPDIPGISERLDPKALHDEWRKIDNLALQQIGANWISSMRSAALLVPSAVVDGEWNVLLNPAHIDFARIEIEAPKVFHFDERMFSR